MSGGFFRGTSADQDTRFSNKQAKLLKSQKFAPELEHLVDVTKVKMDVIRPWIANRVTELLGFEDEVLINFIYGLLDKKDVNGKEIQIQITGFMEKNTGKFMKELWALLLSAQKNASGVPQQFLDAKEEEIRKKKSEADRITLEIQKKEEVLQEKLKKMDSEVDVSEAADDASYPVSKHLPRRASSAHPEEKESEERNGSRGNERFSRSPPSADRSLSSERRTPSRSISKSLSNSRSYSDDRQKSRSISRSPQPRRRSISPEMRYRSPRKRAMSPHKYSPRRPRSPLRRRSPHLRRRTSSHSWRRSPSPRRRRSPSPRRRRSPSPRRRRSPSLRRRRSPSPVRRRSPLPMRRRSRSPLRRRRSPTPSWHRSPSPLRRRSPSPHRRRSLSPMRSPPPRSAKQWRSPLRSPRQRNRRSQSPYESRSPAYRNRRSLSRDRGIRINGAGSKGSRDDYTSQRTLGKRSPARHSPEREEFEHSAQGRQGSDSVSRLPPISLRSPQRDPKDQRDARKKISVLSPSPEKSHSRSESSPRIGKTSLSEDRTPSPSESPMRQTQGQMVRADGASPVRQTRAWVARHDSPKTNTEKETRHARGDGDQRIDSPRKRTRHSPTAGGRRNIPTKDIHHEECSPDRFAERRSGEVRGRLVNIELRKKDRDRKSEKASTRTGISGSPQRSSHMLEEVEYGPGRIEGERFSLDRVPHEQASAKKFKRDSPSSERFEKSCLRDDYIADEKRSHSSNVVDGGRGGKTESVQKSMKTVNHNSQSNAFDTDSEENEKKRSEHVEKKRHKRSGRRKVSSDDDASSDSGVDERKEAKKKRKEEKRLRKEEKRRRREERHRKREERRACRLKAKSVDTVNLPADIEKNRNDADNSDGDVAARRDSHLTDAEETESEQKKLEIELRKKALESLRAKKGINP